MIRVGVTGLRDVSDFDLPRLENSIRAVLQKYRDEHGQSIMLNSIAAGADQLCAEIGLSLGYELVCPLPFAEYRDDFNGEQRKRFDSLIRKSSKTLVVSDSANRDAAYFAAGRYIVEHCDVLLAIWDYRPQTSICGTAAVVAYAQSLGKEIVTVPGNRS